MRALQALSRRAAGDRDPGARAQIPKVGQGGRGRALVVCQCFLPSSSLRFCVVLRRTTLEVTGKRP